MPPPYCDGFAPTYPPPNANPWRHSRDQSLIQAAQTLRVTPRWVPPEYSPNAETAYRLLPNWLAGRAPLRRPTPAPDLPTRDNWPLAHHDCVLTRSQSIDSIHHSGNPATTSPQASHPSKPGDERNLYSSSSLPNLLGPPDQVIDSPDPGGIPADLWPLPPNSIDTLYQLSPSHPFLAPFVPHGNDGP